MRMHTERDTVTPWKSRSELLVDDEILEKSRRVRTSFEGKFYDLEITDKWLFFEGITAGIEGKLIWNYHEYFLPSFGGFNTFYVQFVHA